MGNKEKNQTISTKFIERLSLSLFIIVVLCGFVFTILYIIKFHGPLSSINEDWHITFDIFQGLCIAILTSLNILVFVKISQAIEDNNERRNLRDKVSKIIDSINQSRFNEYEAIKPIILEEISVLTQCETDIKRFDTKLWDRLWSRIRHIDSSILFRFGHDTSCIHEVKKELGDYVNSITECKANNKEDYIKLLSEIKNRLYLILELLESSIILESMNADDIREYLDNNEEENTDSTNYLKNYLKEVSIDE